MTAVIALVALLTAAFWEWRVAKTQPTEARVQRDKGRIQLRASEAFIANQSSNLDLYSAQAL